MPEDYPAASLCFQRGAFTQALEQAGAILEQDPAHADAWALAGDCHLQLGDFAEATRHFARAIECRYGQVRAMNGLALIALEEMRFDDAERLWTQALGMQSGDIAPSCNLARMLMMTGRAEEARVFLTPLAEGLPDEPLVQQSMALISLYDPEATPEVVASWHAATARAWQRSLAQDEDAALGQGPARHAGVTLGFVSQDFNDHAIASFLLPLLRALEGRCQRVLCCTGSITGDWAAAADRVHDFTGKTPAQQRETLSADPVDALIDVDGFFGDAHGLLALRAAPLQLGYLGYPAYHELCDWMLVDPITDPVLRDACPVPVQRMEGCFLCFEPRIDSPPRRSGIEGPLVFGCFNNIAKINSRVLDAWSRILEQVPDSRLLLKSKPLGAPEIRDHIAGELEDRGIVAERFELMGFTATQEEHLALYHQVDIALDTFPYNGTTTTCEALWMGVPAVSFTGDRHAARVGASLLRAANCREWIGVNQEDYIRIAVDLAHDLPGLAVAQASLRERVRASALCDVEGHASRFLDALHKLIGS